MPVRDADRDATVWQMLKWPASVNHTVERCGSALSGSARTRSDPATGSARHDVQAAALLLCIMAGSKTSAAGSDLNRDIIVTCLRGF